MKHAFEKDERNDLSQDLLLSSVTKVKALSLPFK